MKRAHMVFWGTLLGVAYASISVLLVYRTGMVISASLVTPLIFFLILRAFFRATIQEITLTQAIASGASVSVFCLESAFAAAVIFGHAKISFWLLLGIGMGTNLLGLFYARFLMGVYLNRADLPFPKGQAVAKTLLSFDSGAKTGTRPILLSCAGAAVLNLLTILNTKIRNPVAYFFSVPKFIGIDLSPILFGVGMFLPIKSICTMAAGIIYSICLWIFLFKMNGELSFREFLFHPFVLSIAVSLAVGQLLYELREMFAELWKSFSESFSRISGIKWGVISKFLIIFVCLMLFIQNGSINLPLYTIVVMIPLSFLASLIAARSRGESGMASTASVYVIIPIISLMSNDLVSILLVSGGIMLAAIAVSSSLEAMKVGEIVKADIPKLFKFYTWGTMAGTVSGCISIMILNNVIGVGTEQLPAPGALAWGAVARTIVESGSFQSINFYLVILGILISFILSRCSISSIMVSIGILLPVATTLPILTGGVAAYLIEIRKKGAPTQNIGAGLILGGGILSMIEAILLIFK